MGKKASEPRRKEREKIEARIRAGMEQALADEGLDRKDLPEKMDEAPASVNRWLTGPTTIPAWFVGKFCEKFRVDAGSLMGPDDGKKLELERLRALDEMAVLLQKVSEELKKGQVPTGLS
jgi:hypothetical protein